MDLFFAFLAGLLTLLNPCVLPVLPIVIASSLRSGWKGLVYLTFGMGLSFTFVGIVVSAFGHLLGIDQGVVADFAAIAMVFFGLLLLWPGLMVRFELLLSQLSVRADNAMGRLSGSSLSQVFAGVLLGAVWSPCIGPTLGGAIALAASGESLLWATLIMLCFSLGVGVVLVGVGWLVTRGLGTKRLSRVARISKPLLGGVFVLVGIGLYFDVQQWMERWAIENLPYWLQDISVMF